MWFAVLSLWWACSELVFAAATDQAQLVML
jgi:hypothetical protein